MLRWAAILGGVGLVAGFYGSAVIGESNLAGLVALFFTAPAGAVLGLAIGAVLHRVDLPRRTENIALVAAAAVMALVTLAIFIPQSRLVGHLLDAEVRSCANPRSMKADAVARLAAAEPAYKEKRPLRSWDAEFEQALARTPGVVVELFVRRSQGVLEGRASWKRGKLSGDRWAPSNGVARYFIAGATCAAYPAGAQAILFGHGATNIWPPSDIAEMLAVQKADAPTPQQAELAGR
jgi:hypothetical protein